MNQRFLNVIRRGATALAGIALVAGLALPAHGRDRGPEGQQRRTSPFNLGASATFLMNYNEWLCGIQQIGEVCTSAVGSSVGGGGFWPSGTANQYIFNSGLQMAGKPAGGPNQGKQLATFFFNASGPGAGASVKPIYASNNPDDLANWPEECYLDNPVFGRVKTISELDTCVIYWDGDPTASHFSDSKPMGIQVTQHSMLWSFPNNKDILFFSYKFKNVTDTDAFRTRNPGTPAGGYALTDLYAAFAMDPDVSGSEYSENYATVVPDLNMAVAWQYDFDAHDFVPYAPNFDAAPGFVGVKYLKSPTHTGTEPVTVRVGESERVVQPGEELGLTFFSVFTNGGIMSDADNASQAFRYLSGQLTEAEKASWCPHGIPGVCYVELQEPDDMRFYQSSGPFTLKPGEEQEIVVAYIAGAPVPGTYVKGQVLPPTGATGELLSPDRPIEKVMGRGYDRPGFPSLFANAKIAQAIYDANFVLPASPQSPNVTILPGDKQNTVVWDAAPVENEDPFAQLAQDPSSALYDPDFRAKDFEGFRVYRKSNPSADWKLIAQFDQANGVNEIVTVQEVVTTAAGDELIVKADTARVCRPEDSGCEAETGLKFGIVDRGGEFPNPENGPGLINGVRYFYAVTSFDINSPQSGPSSLESARVLSNSASGIPRATAAGKTALKVGEVKILDSEGNELDPKKTVSIDPATGTFSGPQPPTNGFSAGFDLYDELLIPQGTYELVIDSIVPLNGYESVLGVHFQANAEPTLGVSAAYFLTAKTPSGNQTMRVEIPEPFVVFGGPTGTEAAGLATVKADAQKAQELGIKGDHFAAALSAGVEHLRQYRLSGTEAVTVFRAHVYDDVMGSRWFSGSEPANPTVGVKQGELPGVSNIYGVADAYERGFVNFRWGGVYLMTPVMRAADMEVTWGDNGTIAKVWDLTHNVEVPFHEGYRASWGVRNESDTDGDDILSMGDFWMVTPTSEWYCEVAGCHSALERQARIQPLSSTPPKGWGSDVSAATAQGFGLYIAGEMFLFETDQLPAAGTKWTLRTYTGIIRQNAAGEYSFSMNPTRPPSIPGLRAQVAVESAASYNLADADLSKVHTVPDPYLITNLLETSTAEKRLLFVGLPTEATIRIYTLSGVLVAALQHDDPAGGGQLEWDLRTRNNQFVASGVYFYHVETPDGKEKLGKFTVVQYAQ